MVSDKMGNFVVHKSGQEYSAMSIDQAHEQTNAVIKGVGGAIGLTEDPSALRRWMVAGPEVSHWVSQYEAASKAKDVTEGTDHHEQREKTQRLFHEKVGRLTIQDMGNPFQEDSGDLLTLDTKDIAHTSAVALLGQHYDRGKEQFLKFMDALESRDENMFYQPIKKNKLAFFKQGPAASNPKQNTLKEDSRLFSQLFISCQSRKCDLQEFFKHENQTVPAALSDNGKLHSCQKSQLVEILETQIVKSDIEPEADFIIIDGSALLNALPTQASKTFDDYAKNDVFPTIEALSAKYKRTDVVFDVYLPCSLKSETREKRGQGIRRRVTSISKTPKNWQNFLRDGNNKTELFYFLADKIAEISTSHTIVITKGENVVSNQLISSENLAPCSHEEADTRIFVHARHAAMEGNKALVITANDTDVLVIAIAVEKSKIGLTFFIYIFSFY